MKSFEHLVLSHLKSITASHLDSLQFAYRANRSVDDAVDQALHLILEHLDSPGTNARILKFTDDTTLIRLISDGDESAYRREVERLVSWCSHNNLELNAQKTVEMTPSASWEPPSLRTSKWEPTIRSLMFFLRQLQKLRLPTKLLVEFYTAIIQSILASSITVWYSSATSRDKSRLQRIVCSAEKVDRLQPATSSGPVCLQDPETCRSDQSRPFSSWT
ncbi:uncharacterized protein LOC128757084 [Synchiropus splendidus]|uniref:uncharacterized protein LOC128757084 n=1 Tax=Synchiropus splendidus TaxID=270530 RepID=UPI00237D8C2B|nr:uncharacterized protein LOC128757084 [Synchiropus splendidus]